MKSLANMLEHFTNNFSADKVDINHITMFFLSYYYIKPEEKHNQNILAFKIGQQIARTFKNPTWNIFMKMFSLKEKRTELIEDILHYIASCQTVPILQHCINNCFIDFLENASSSLAFQTYLDNVMSQTKQMTEIEKF